MFCNFLQFGDATFSNSRLQLSVILFYNKHVDILKKNIEFLLKQVIIKDVVCITQVMNLEDELVRSCSIKRISELTRSKSNTDFKKDVLHISN